MADADPAGNKPLSVFISYSRDDVEFADQLHATLIIGGYDATIDRRGIQVGEDWERRLGDMIRAADTIVFLLSPSSACSAACAWEVDQATQLGKRIIPIACRALDGQAPPPALAALNYIYLYPEPRKPGTGFGPGLLDLRTALNTDLDWLREHTRLLQRASEWESGGRLSIRLLSGHDIDASRAWAARQPKAAPAPTALHLAYFRASEDEEARRSSAEAQRLDQMAQALAARGVALEQQAQAQAREAEAVRREALQAKRVVRRTLAGLAAALVLAALAGAFGYDADRQRQRAQRVLDQSISNANARVVAIAERAAARSRSRQAIVGVAATAASSTAGTVRSADADLERIAGLVNLSAQLLDQEDAAAASRAADTGIDLAETGAGAQQTDSRWQMARSRLQQRLGLAAATQGRSDRAAQALATSLALARALAEAEPTRSDVRARLAEALQDIGDMGVRSRQFDQAERHFAELLRMRQTDADLPGATEVTKRQLATALNRMANLLLAREQPRAAIDACALAMATLQPLGPGTATGAEGAAQRRELSIAYHLTADAWRASRQPANAIAWLEKDLDFTRALSERPDADATARHDLATVYAKLGLLHDELGHTDAALANLAQAIALGGAPRREAHRRPEWLRDTAAALELRATMLVKAGRAGETVPALRRALAIREQVASASPDAVWQRELEDAYRRTGAVLLKLDYRAEALEAAEQLLFATSLAPDDDPTKNARVARALGELCWTALFAKDIPRARWAGEQATAIDPDLGFARLNFAHALMYAGDAAGARRIYVDAAVSGAAAQPWHRMIREDFAELSARRLRHPQMSEIDRELGP